MNFLLDSVAVLFWIEDNPRLPPSARQLISAANTSLWVSAASLWELAIKASRVRSPLSLDVLEKARIFVAGDDCQALPVTERHAFHIATLPLHHRDPFDRLLIAQSQLEGMPILTNDAAFQKYEVEVRW